MEQYVHILYVGIHFCILVNTSHVFYMNVLNVPICVKSNINKSNSYLLYAIASILLNDISSHLL